MNLRRMLDKIFFNKYTHNERETRRLFITLFSAEAKKISETISCF